MGAGLPGQRDEEAPRRTARRDYFPPATSFWNLGFLRSGSKSTPALRGRRPRRALAPHIVRSWNLFGGWLRELAGLRAAL